MLTRALLLVSLAIQTGTTAVPCPPPAERLPLGALATGAPYYHEGSVVEACGTIGSVRPAPPGERVLYEQSRHDAYGIYVSDPAAELPADGERACLVGVLRRRDGLTWKEAMARGLPTLHLTDTLVQFRDYVFYPIRCGPAPAPERGERG